MKKLCRRLRMSALCTVSLFLGAWPCRAQQRPLKADDPELLAVGRVRIEMGLEFLQGQHFTLSGLEGDLTRVGVAAVHAGVGEYAEFQLSGVIQDFLSVTRREPAYVPPDFVGNATSDFGDPVFAGKLKLLADAGKKPALAFKFAVELPVASNESGLGSDETDFYASLLVSKRVGPARVLGSIGLAILGSAVEPNTQADKLTYGFALIVPLRRRLNIAGEVSGREGPDRIGNEDQGQARLGLQILSGSLRWDVAAIAGLRKHDAPSGIVFGVTYEFQAFAKTRKPRTIR